MSRASAFCVGNLSGCPPRRTSGTPKNRRMSGCGNGLLRTCYAPGLCCKHLNQFSQERIQTMASLALATPILPGQTEAWKRLIAEVTGPRRMETDDFHRRLGFTKTDWYLQQTPNGDIFI